MAIPQERQNFNYADYLKLSDDERYEVIEGQIYNMSPSPTVKHQDVLGRLYARFLFYLEGKLCRVFIAPIDVCLFAKDDDTFSDIKEWVIPDMVVICDKNKIGDKWIIGTPDLIVEVLAHSTAKHDRLTKFYKYQKAGVKEYWIVDPANETIEVYMLQDGMYKQSGIYGNNDILPVSSFEDFNIDLNYVFRSDEDE